MALTLITSDQVRVVGCKVGVFVHRVYREFPSLGDMDVAIDIPGPYTLESKVTPKGFLTCVGIFNE